MRAKPVTEQSQIGEQSLSRNSHKWASKVCHGTVTNGRAKSVTEQSQMRGQSLSRSQACSLCAGNANSPLIQTRDDCISLDLQTSDRFSGTSALARSKATQRNKKTKIVQLLICTCMHLCTLLHVFHTEICVITRKRPMYICTYTYVHIYIYAYTFEHHKPMAKTVGGTLTNKSGFSSFDACATPSASTSLRSLESSTQNEHARCSEYTSLALSTPASRSAQTCRKGLVSIVHIFLTTYVGKHAPRTRYLKVLYDAYVWRLQSSL
jgi:hypothetical protein